MPKAEGIILGPSAQPFPRPVYPSIVEIKEDWDGDWTFEPHLFLARCSVCSGGHDLSSAEITYRYGAIKQPWDSSFSTKTPGPDVTGWWVRVSLIGDQGQQEIFVGRFSGEARNPAGSDSVDRGTRTFVAYGPEDILRKIYVGRSYWVNEGPDPEWFAAPLDIGWVPDVNDRDGRGLIAGNRSRVTHENRPGEGGQERMTYVYAGHGGVNEPTTWTNKQYAEYILGRFCNEKDGILWTLGGQADLLDGLVEVHSMGTTQTVSDILRMLISTRKGLDYRVVPTENGFEIRVFALAAKSWSFAGVTLPTNPQTVTIYPTSTKDVISTTLVRSSDQRYGRIRVLGAQAIVAFSLDGEKSPDGPNIDGERIFGLETKWTDTIDAAYRAADYDPPGSEAKIAEGYDDVRREERFADVYRKFGLAADVAIACISLDEEGDLENPGDPDLADAQYSDRSTLSWVPMWTGVDYTGQQPVDYNGDDDRPELLRPQVWLRTPEGRQWFYRDDATYYPVTEHGFSVSVLKNDVGFLLGGKLNHVMAYNHFTATGESANAAATAEKPRFDYDELIATLAVRTDQRLVLEHKIDGWTPIDGTLDIVDEDAELWLLHPFTFLEYDHDANEPKHSGEDWKTLRNDRQRLAFTMAGALARYSVDRFRASVAVRGLSPWGDLVGQILKAVDAGDGLQDIQAPITAVEWIGGNNPQTIIRTGFAE